MDDSDNEKDFMPTLYLLTLRDIFDRPISIQSDNCKIESPPFNILLDQVIAVLWIVYSQKNTELLQCGHVQWALKFLEDLKDKNNQYTKDVEMAVIQLQDVLVDLCARCDIGENENYHSAILGETEPTSYEHFEEFLKGKELSDSTLIELIRNAKEKPCPSIMLQDLLKKTNTSMPLQNMDNLDNMNEIPENDMTKNNCQEMQIKANITDWRCSQYQKIMNLIEQMMQLDESGTQCNCNLDSTGTNQFNN